MLYAKTHAHAKTHAKLMLMLKALGIKTHALHPSNTTLTNTYVAYW